ncbi:hypothetical protein [Singulisphaera sp. PoT]|uniref:hypothetical protein n=1 Tax=Singulisphaera sp. PoT TaxID=3411797 RepID=UPI003BF584CC
MKCLPLELRGRCCRPSILAVGLAFALAFLGLDGVARASAEVDASWNLDAKPATGASHHCKCGEACRGPACCCSKPAPARFATTTDEASTLESGPCIGAIPCGGEGLPGPSPSWQAAKSALLAMPTKLRLDAPIARLHVGSMVLPPRILAPRLDDPPELLPTR